MTLIPSGVINLNNTDPGPPVGTVNVKWQSQSPNNVPRDVSAYVGPPTTTVPGVVPVLPSTAPTTYFLRGDGTWATVSASGLALKVNGVANGDQALLNLANGTAITVTDGGTGTVTIASPTFVASGASHAAGSVPDPGSSAGTTRFLREDATWVVPPAPPTLKTDGTNNGSQAILNLANGTAITVTDGGTGTVTIASPTFVASGASHAAGSVPDPGSSAGTSRFLREDASWAIPPTQTGPRPSIAVWHYWNAYNGASSASGVNAGGNTMQLESSAATTIIGPSSTDNFLAKTNVASGSTGPCGYDEVFAGVGNGVMTIAFCIDWQARVRTPTATTSGGRYWIGLSNNSTSSPIANGVYETDTPTPTMVAFRFSAGTDTHWQAYVGTSGAHTIVDTGVTPNTTQSHLFEIQFTGGNALFYIDGTLVATITNTTNTSPFSSTMAGDNKTNHLTSGVELDLAFVYWESTR